MKLVDFRRQETGGFGYFCHRFGVSGGVEAMARVVAFGTAAIPFPHLPEVRYRNRGGSRRAARCRNTPVRWASRSVREWPLLFLRYIDAQIGSQKRNRAIVHLGVAHPSTLICLPTERAPSILLPTFGVVACVQHSASFAPFGEGVSLGVSLSCKYNQAGGKCGIPEPVFRRFA